MPFEIYNDCRDNKITFSDNLPSQLTTLFCSKNEINLDKLKRFIQM